MTKWGTCYVSGHMDPTPHSPKSPTDDHLLEDLAAMTGLLNPERIWQEEQQLDDLHEVHAGQGHPPAQPEPGTPAAD
jgi:hypothetical protein